MIQKSMASESRPPLKRNILSFDLKSRISASIETFEQLRQRGLSREVNIQTAPLNTELDEFLNSLKDHDFGLNHKVLKCKEILHNYKNNLPNSISRTEQHDENNQIVLHQVNDKEKLTIENKSQQKSCCTSSTISSSIHDEYTTTSSSSDSSSLVQNESLRKQTNSCYDKISIDDRIHKLSSSTESTMSLTLSTSDENSSENIFQSHCEFTEFETIGGNDCNDCKKKELHLSHNQLIDDDDENLSLDDNGDDFYNDDHSIDNDSLEFKLILILSTIEEESENELDFVFNETGDKENVLDTVNKLVHEIGHNEAEKVGPTLKSCDIENETRPENVSNQSLNWTLDSNQSSPNNTYYGHKDREYDENQSQNISQDSNSKLSKSRPPKKPDLTQKIKKRGNFSNDQDLYIDRCSVNENVQHVLNQRSGETTSNVHDRPRSACGIDRRRVIDERPSTACDTVRSTPVLISRPRSACGSARKSQADSKTESSHDNMHRRSFRSISPIGERPSTACNTDRRGPYSQKSRTPIIDRHESSSDTVDRRPSIKSRSPIIERPGTACNTDRRGPHFERSRTPIFERPKSSSDTVCKRLSIRSRSPISERPSTPSDTLQRGPYSQKSRLPINERPKSLSNPVQNHSNVHRSRTPTSQRPKTPSNALRGGPNIPRSITPIIDRPESSLNSVQSVTRSRTPISERPKSSSDTMKKGPNVHRSRTPVIERPKSSSNTMQSTLNVHRSRTPKSQRLELSSNNVQNGHNVHRSRTSNIERPESACKTERRVGNCHRSRTPVNEVPETPSNTVKKGLNVHRSRTPFIERPDPACKTERRGPNSQRSRTPIIKRPESVCDTVQKAPVIHKSKTTKTTMQKTPVHNAIESGSYGRCRSKWNPQKYASIGGCQSCYSLLSAEERKQYVENGFHHRVASNKQLIFDKADKSVLM